MKHYLAIVALAVGLGRPAAKELSGIGGAVSTLHAIRLDDDMKEMPGTDFELKAELVLLAMGFVHPVHEGMIEELGNEQGKWLE